MSPRSSCWLLAAGAAALLLSTPPADADADRAPSDRAATGTPAAPGRRAGLERHLGAQVPLGARFVASDGRQVTLGDVLQRNEPSLLVLAYNRCSMLCSLVLRRVAELVPELSVRPGEQYSLLTVSIDPSDTVLEAARMQDALLERAGLPGERQRWQFLVGQRGEIDRLADALGFRYAWDPSTAQYDHPAVLFTLSPEGRVSGYFDGLQPDVAALNAALGHSGPTLAAISVQDVILECFRFDTSRSRYGSVITWLLRAGGASVALALLGLVWWLGRGGHGRAAPLERPAQAEGRRGGGAEP